MLKHRYPDIGFYLSFFPFTKVTLPTDSAELNFWLNSQNLEELEIIYCVGLINFPLPISLRKWLEGKKERALIFIENELGAFADFNDLFILNHSQIHLHYAEKDPTEELAEQFPSDRVGVLVQTGKEFNGLELKRRGAALSALYSEVLYSHLLVSNVMTNYQRLPQCFNATQWRNEFKGTPAIICGAGPSLEKAFPFLKQAKDRALIFAGGSTITILSQNEIEPDLAIALDPNEEEFDRLKQSHYFEGPFLFAPRLHKDVFATTNGPFGYLKTDTGGLIESWLEQKLHLNEEPIGPDLGPEAFSVTTLALSYAHALGCNPIIFAGVDLAYTNGKRYAKGVEAAASPKEDPRALEKVLERKDIHGKSIETLLKWVMEADTISTFAKNHPETTFINATEGGIGFEGIENRPLSSLLNIPSQDMGGKIHQLIQAHPLYLEDKFDSLYSALFASLNQCKKLCDQMLIQLEKQSDYKETGQMFLIREDLLQEEAFICFLEGIDAALDKLLPRYYPSLDPQKAKLERSLAKYRELLLQIERFKSSLTTLSPLKEN